MTVKAGSYDSARLARMECTYRIVCTGLNCYSVETAKHFIDVLSPRLPQHSSLY